MTAVLQQCKRTLQRAAARLLAELQTLGHVLREKGGLTGVLRLGWRYLRREGLGGLWRRAQALYRRESVGLVPDAGDRPAGADDPRPLVVFVSGEPETPGHVYRVARMATALPQERFRTAVLPASELHRSAALLAGADLLWVWRSHWTRSLAWAVDLVRKRGGAYVFDLDDLLLDPALAQPGVIDGMRSLGLPQDGVARGMRLLREAALQAEVCTAPTDYLAQRLAALGKRTLVIPNGFDAPLLERSRRARADWLASRPDALLRIGYAGGSRTHQADFRVVAPALARMLAHYPQARLVLFAGTMDLAEFPELAPLVGQVEWRDFVPLADLPGELARFDVNIAPLVVGNAFCEAKSELKYFEAALVGVPTVASPTAPFVAAMEHGGTGFLAGSETEWAQYLDLLLGDAALRARLAEQALAAVLEHYGPERRGVLAGELVGELLAARQG